MDKFRMSLFSKAGYTGFSISLDRRCSTCEAPSGLTYFIKYADIDKSQLVEGYKRGNELLVERSCLVDTTLFQQRLLSRTALQRVPKHQESFLEGYGLNLVVHERPTTFPDGRRKPRKR
jgi:hypothetical protein